MILSILFPLAAFAILPELPAAYLEANGKEFAHLGPNCFASALKITGATKSFRGMDEPEFREFTRLYCERVENPRLGDIGVYHKPGFAFIHAYAYISPEYGMEKPGVDYVGKTPIAIAHFNSIDYRFLASPECRRYSQGDISACANEHSYLRCEPIHFKGAPHLESHDRKIRKIEKGFDRLLEQTSPSEEDSLLFTRLDEEVRSAATDLDRLSLGAYGPFLKARVVSLKKQLDFMRPKLGGNHLPQN